MVRTSTLPFALPFALGVAACMGLAACGGDSAAADSGDGAVSVPEARAVDTAGLVDWIAQQRGKPVVVNFWGTWCGPCLMELPDLLAGTRAFRDQGGVVVGVALEQYARDMTDEQAVEKAGAKARELGLDIPTLVCTDDEMQVIRDGIGVEIGGLPQTLAYDREGKLVAHHEGVATRAQFEELAARAAAR